MSADEWNETETNLEIDVQFFLLYKIIEIDVQFCLLHKATEIDVQFFLLHKIIEIDVQFFLLHKIVEIDVQFFSTSENYYWNMITIYQYSTIISYSIPHIQ